ncbi:Spy/CpxP family protein refolding chaperone [Desulfoscipio geothermicus]|uniref:Protein CpxP n=1 Tax=Desulfoscipio geothermicus DSM 3669 TaxID=1121426 RepID=A0A1I6D1W8_9FIRM|nr:Spy/CpxP family protein refolding chaperone [Desulfoscipio geothermicus]SFQ99496.1 protein CpxP [Desulfoscipio geothermicus DSM 3669]
MKKKMIVLTVTLVLVLGIAQVASAAGMGWGGGPRMLDSDNWVSPVEALNLTDQQIETMQQLQKSSYEQTGDLRDKLRDLMFDLRQYQLQKDPDQAQIDAKIKQINDLRSQLYNIKAQNREQMQSQLTTEQLAEMAKMRGFGKHGARGFGGFSGTN